MALPSPWKTHPRPSSPSRLRRPTLFTLRTRSRGYLGILLLIIIMAIYLLNDAVCMDHTCLSRIGFYGDSRSGGATLPANWKHRLGEQLQLNTMALSHVSDEKVGDEVQEKLKEAHEDGNGALVGSLTDSEESKTTPTAISRGDRWIDAPPQIEAPAPDWAAQMEEDRKMYVDGVDIEAPPPQRTEPPKEAEPDPLEFADQTQVERGSAKATSKSTDREGEYTAGANAKGKAKVDATSTPRIGGKAKPSSRYENHSAMHTPPASPKAAAQISSKVSASQDDDDESSSPPFLKPDTNNYPTGDFGSMDIGALTGAF